jgi:serine/threonine protein kinase
MAKISKPVWWLETYCIERYFRRRSKCAFKCIHNSRSKGRLCLRYDHLFLKIVFKRHDRYFSFCNEMDRLVRLKRPVWAPRFRCRLERPRYTIFAYQFYEMPDLNTLMSSGKLSPKARHRIAVQLRFILDSMEKIGLMHRDITPANLLFDAASERLMLIDFQWARDLNEEIRVASPREHKMLAYCLSVAGGRYRKPGSASSGFEQDRYSVDKIIAELERPFEANKCV